MSQVHLEPSDPLTIRFRDRFFAGRDLVSVPIDRSLLRAQCYANVVDVVAAEGGSLQLAWLITAWPGRFVEGMHHALWRDPEGDLHDVTAHGWDGMTNQHSTVILDNMTLAPEDYWHPAVPPWFLVLDDTKETKNYVRYLREHVVARGRAMTLARELGAIMERGEDQMLYVVIDPTKVSQAARDYAERAEELRLLMMKAKAALEG